MSYVTEMPSTNKVHFDNIIKFIIDNWENKSKVSILNGIKLYVDKQERAVRWYWKNLILQVEAVVDWYISPDDSVSSYLITWMDDLGKVGSASINVDELQYIEIQSLEGNKFQVPFEQCNDVDFFTYDVIGICTPGDPYIFLKFINKIIQVHNEKNK